MRAKRKENIQRMKNWDFVIYSWKDNIILYNWIVVSKTPNEYELKKERIIMAILEKMDEIQKEAGKNKPEYPKIVDGRRDDSEGLAPESYYGQGDKFPLPTD